MIRMGMMVDKDSSKTKWYPSILSCRFVLAAMHSKIGNKWQVLAKYLPRRPENTVKNHW